MSKNGGFFARIAKFFREIKAELKKVVWPTWSQVRNNTGVVIVSILVVGVCIWLLDALF
ncbi:MAG: preprotein translocase subunit SecE, partial [Clostridia bacterium]|nr:preprotein translocase subunit SecE [Clostridia bacterium]